jgi:SNF2 family DNA or RNA helicase
MLAQYATELDSGTVITAVNAADRIGKMRQLLCGIIKTGENEYEAIDFKPRLTLLLECIQEANAKVIVVVPFKGIIKFLEEEIAKTHSCAVLNGDVSPKKRNEIVSAFKHSKDPHVLLCHPKVMSHGLTLTEADTLIFYAPIYSNDEYQQVKDRINRPGQTRNMTIVRMAGHKLEWNIYKALDGKGLNQSSILDMYRETVKGLTR